MELEYKLKTFSPKDTLVMLSLSLHGHALSEYDISNKLKCKWFNHKSL